MPSKPPLLEQITQSPLLIDMAAQQLFQSSIQHVVAHEHATEFLAAATTQMSDQDFWPAHDDWRAAYRPYNVRGGVLQIPVMGVLLNRFPWQLGRWATGYTYIEQALKRGMADPEVKGIAFIHDSPGGEVAGCFELGDKIYEARGEKPMRSFAADHSYSASYLLSSAEGPISVTRSGGVGSIGVVTAHVEYSEMLKDVGIKVTFIFAGKHKVDGNAYEKLPEGVKSRIQDRIDRIYGVFTTAVARNRKMEDGDVRKTEALTFDANEAIEKGLADRIGSLEDEMVLFSTEVAAAGDEQMATNTTENGVPQATHDKAVADARAAGKTEGMAEGAKAATDRFAAILNSDAAKTRTKSAVKMALNPKLAAVDADGIVEMLAELPEEKAEAPAGGDAPKGKTDAKRNHFDEQMSKDNPNISGTEESDGKDTAETRANSILADYAGMTGVQRKQSA